MFGFGMPELIIVLVLALVVVGPAKIPQLGQSLGSAIRGFKKGMHEEDVKVINKVNEA
ncbi:twin-arginine translocase TatA/TatE family subunit [Geobacter pickeringii]|uniref:Sec-independent protein translocase protein TatA n=1 Tax=Geobacter pickeringii TaxID=345632 RepID=A0A0B5BFC5_9BACT|nr:twin-arginine translocase TatA/TatE family subunit [Geobacter pickeringii]AJE02776.1 preprotein translocase subunit SecA [Geobacter pickeringii]